MPAFVGRKEPLNRLAAAYQAVAAPPKSAISGWVGLVLVIGEAGIGKTALLTRFADQIAADVGTVLWGSCWNGDQAPAWWPWTQALRSLLDQRIDLREAVRPELAAIVPDLPTDSSPVRSDPADRVRVLDSAAQLLHRAAVDRPVVVFLDDLQWADPSTMDLLRFVSHQPRSGALLLVGAYRPEELPPNIAGILGDLASAAELVPLQGLSGDEVADLVRAVTGAAARDDCATVVHERSGGHPFFARELCQLLATGGNPTDVPAAVRDVIGRRLARLSPGCATLLDVAAVAGGTLLPDVLAEVTRLDTTQVAALTEEAVAARILTSTRDPDHGTRFVHDLYRETLYAGLAPARRLALHHRVATALLGRHERGSPVFAAELAYHFTAAIPATDTAAAVLWAQSAARADAVRFAFVEAAGHLTRLRSAVARGGESLPETVLIRLLTDEAELRLRGGNAVQAQALLETAWTRATAAGQAELLAAVALGLDRLDSRFAMPRGDLIEVLGSTRDALKGTGTTLEAKVTAALARQLQHSVPADRPRAGSLADEAVRIARVLDDPATLASCLLAQHDTRWTPGTASARAEIAAAIGDLARQVNDPERQAQALLLSATAQLENGSPAFRATFAEYAYFSERLRQPRHNYLLRTRQAALALLDGDIDAGERLSAEAAVLGEAVGDTDVGNVRMSQRLEVVRARNQPAELREMAADAVRWWIGAHAHAHAVAAGFYARAGDLDAARRELNTVLALDDWRADRSYLWSVFIGEMATAAIALRDHQLCQRLLDDLLPVADTCAVNGALVCYMGAHAHRVGLLHAALDQTEAARQRLEQALEIHRQLGARAWEAETWRALRNFGSDETLEDSDTARLQRVGDMWQASYRGHTAFLRDTKGLHDLATLLAHPGTDVSALTLAGGGASHLAHTGATEPVLDHTALLAYRRRLAQLDDDLAMADQHSDLARHQRATDERERLLAELRHATRPGGMPRRFGNAAAERARKAVTARIRDAIHRITDAHPELGAHLDRTIRTGTTCRYEPTSTRH